MGWAIEINSKDLKAQLGYKESDPLRVVKNSEYNQIRPESLGLEEGEKIAVIYATGDIGSGKSENSPTGGQSVGRYDGKSSRGRSRR